MKQFSIIVMVVLLGVCVWAQQPTAKEIIDAADKYRGSENWSFDLKVIDLTKESGEVKILSTDEYKVVGQAFGIEPNRTFKSICQFLTPAQESGKKMFMDSQIYWLYFPNTKNLVRITPAQRLSGQATAADIASINFGNDYTGQIVGTETVLEKHDCYKLKLSKKQDDVAYHSLNYWVEKQTYKPIKAEFFADTGKLLKTGYYRGFAPVLGKMQAHELFIIDAVNESRVTRLVQSNKAEMKVPEYIFRKETFFETDLLELVASPDAADIVKKADQYRGADSWGCNLKVIDFQKEKDGAIKKLSESEFRLASKVFGEAGANIYKAFVQFIAPKQEAGKKMLMDGQIYWMAFPETQNLIRITPAQRLAGQATASDIASTNFGADYNPQIMGSETIMNVACYKLKLLAKSENVAYPSLNYWVEKESFKPLKVEYFAASGNLLKVAYFRELKMAPAMGSVKVHELFIIDPIKEGHVTRITYSNLQPETRPDYFFTKDSFAKYTLTEADAKVELAPVQIIRNADQYRGADNWGFDLDIVDFKKSGDDVKILSQNGFSNLGKVFNDGKDQLRKCVCNFTSPKEEVGKKMLMDGHIYWLYFPNTKNMIRITPAQRLAGQATAADIAATNFEYDYEGEFASPKEEVVIDKHNCFKMTLTAKPDKNVAYPKLTYWVEKDTFRPIKIEYFSVTGEHLKTAYYREFKEASLMKQIKAHELFIIDPVQEGHITKLIYSNIRFENTPDYVFTKDQLDK